MRRGVKPDLKLAELTLGGDKWRCSADRRWFSNGVWAVLRDLLSLSDGPLPASVEAIPIGKVESLFPDLAKVAPFERTPLVWGNATCFVAEDGRRAWVDSRVAAALKVDVLFATSVDGALIDCDASEDVRAVVMPFTPPSDKLAARVLRDLESEGINEEMLARAKREANGPPGDGNGIVHAPAAPSRKELNFNWDGLREKIGRRAPLLRDYLREASFVSYEKDGTLTLETSDVIAENLRHVESILLDELREHAGKAKAVIYRPSKRRKTAKQAVADALPDPRELAKLAAVEAGAELCEADGCDFDRLPGKRHCERHAAPDPNLKRCSKVGCLYLVEKLVRGEGGNADLCEGHAAEARSAASKVSPAPAKREPAKGPAPAPAAKKDWI